MWLLPSRQPHVDQVASGQHFPSQVETAKALDGNLCRGVRPHIIRAVVRAAKIMDAHRSMSLLRSRLFRMNGPVIDDPCSCRGYNQVNGGLYGC